jgi:hypothetical protein
MLTTDYWLLTTFIKKRSPAGCPLVEAALAEKIKNFDCSFVLAGDADRFSALLLLG